MIPIGLSGSPSEFRMLVTQKVMNILGNYIEGALNDDLEEAVAIAGDMPDVPTTDPGAVEGLTVLVETLDQITAGVHEWRKWAMRQRAVAEKFIAEQETT